MRCAGPAGLVCATAADVVAFARLHLDGGMTAEGAQLLTGTSVAEMQQPRTHDPSARDVRRVGLGWALFEWAGRRVLGHDGDTIGQAAVVRIVPDADVAVALLGNTDTAMSPHRDLLAELLPATCDLEVAPLPEPPATPCAG